MLKADLRHTISLKHMAVRFSFQAQNAFVNFYFERRSHATVMAVFLSNVGFENKFSFVSKFEQ